MKKLLLLLIFPLLIACEPSSVDVGREAYEKYFKSTLKDPESFKVYSEKYEVAPDGYKIKWKIDYGAKNGFGGMVREKAEFYTIGKKIYFDGIYGGVHDTNDL